MFQLSCRLGILAGLTFGLAALPTFGQAQKKDPPAILSPDGKLLATAQEKEISILDAQTQKILIRMNGHTGQINGLAISPDSKLLASGGEDKAIALWELATGKQILKVTAPTAVIFVGFSQDGKTLLSQQADTTTRVWDIATGQILQKTKK